MCVEALCEGWFVGMPEGMEFGGEIFRTVKRNILCTHTQHKTKQNLKVTNTKNKKLKISNNKGWLLLVF